MVVFIVLLGLVWGVVGCFLYWVYLIKVVFFFVFLVVIGWNTFLSWCLLHFVGCLVFVVLLLVGFLVFLVFVEFV